LQQLLGPATSMAHQRGQPSSRSGVIELLSEYASERKLTEDGSLRLIISSRIVQLKKQLMDSAKDDHPLNRF
jgi:hypothetical protein